MGSFPQGLGWKLKKYLSCHHGESLKQLDSVRTRVRIAWEPFGYHSDMKTNLPSTFFFVICGKTERKPHGGLARRRLDLRLFGANGTFPNVFSHNGGEKWWFSMVESVINDLQQQIQDNRICGNWPKPPSMTTCEWTFWLNIFTWPNATFKDLQNQSTFPGGSHSPTHLNIKNTKICQNLHLQGWNPKNQWYVGWNSLHKWGEISPQLPISFGHL